MRTISVLLKTTNNHTRAGKGETVMVPIDWAGVIWGQIHSKLANQRGGGEHPIGHYFVFSSVHIGLEGGKFGLKISFSSTSGQLVDPGTNILK